MCARHVSACGCLTGSDVAFASLLVINGLLMSRIKRNHFEKKMYLSATKPLRNKLLEA